MFLPETLEVRVRIQAGEFESGDISTPEEYKFALIADQLNSTGDKFKGALSYITYRDEKNVIRKEKSWSGWGNLYLGSFDNKPTKYTFFTTKQRSRDWFGSGRSVFEMLHPQGFRFQITANNLSEIILNCSIINGEIQEECVLGWEGTQLALIPVNSELYKDAIELTNFINAPKKRIKTDALIHDNELLNAKGKSIGIFKKEFEVVAVSNDISLVHYHTNNGSKYHCEGDIKISKPMTLKDVVISGNFHIKDLPSSGVYSQKSSSETNTPYCHYYIYENKGTSSYIHVIPNETQLIEKYIQHTLDLYSRRSYGSSNNIKVVYE